MDSLIFELQIVFYFQLFLSANVRHRSTFLVDQRFKRKWINNIFQILFTDCVVNLKYCEIVMLSIKLVLAFHVKVKGIYPYVAFSSIFSLRSKV